MDKLEKTNKNNPWEIDKSLVDVLESYDAQVDFERDNYYSVSFFDEKGSYVEAEMSKKLFKNIPHEIESGTHFWMVMYKIKNQANSKYKLSVWPVAEYWHKSWDE